MPESCSHNTSYDSDHCLYMCKRTPKRHTWAKEHVEIEFLVEGDVVYDGVCECGGNGAE